MHPTHKEDLPKLNRASGQIEAVKRMVGEEKSCIDIITQIRAARSALKSVELSILARHMNSCLIEVCDKDHKSQEDKISEIIVLLKKYE